MVSLTKSEYEILSLLWAEDRPLSALDINSLAEQRSWKDSSVHLMLNSMLEKGVIVVDGVVKSGRTYGRLFRAAITPEEYSLMQVERNASFRGKKSFAYESLVSSFLNSGDISRESLDKIEELIRKKKAEM